MSRHDYVNVKNARSKIVKEGTFNVFRGATTGVATGDGAARFHFHAGRPY